MSNLFNGFMQDFDYYLHISSIIYICQVLLNVLTTVKY